MATGRRLVVTHDEHGCAVLRTRKWNDRDHKSDRQKRARKLLSKTLRTRLKREYREIINSEVEENPRVIIHKEKE